MQQFSAKTFSLNFFHTLTYPFLMLFGLKCKFPFMENAWLGMYHYSNQSLTVVSFPLKHTFHMKVCRLSQGLYFQIHYYFAQTVISTGNLHPAMACICRGNRNETPVCVVGVFFFFFLNSYQAARHTKAAEWKCKRKLGCKIGKVLWLSGIGD